jgi:NAD(P)-dependent dehydrogenase (short-subunit alcohol dehydrogenase family)
MRIEGKVVLITGASGGIGAACAAEFARAGARPATSPRTTRATRRSIAPSNASAISTF